VKLRYLAGALALSAAIATAACGDDPPPTTPTPTPTPTPPPPANPVLTAPRADAPAENDQLQTLRPTLRVLNATADQAGTRSYEFQISDDPDFAPATAASMGRYYRVVLTQGNVAEGGDGKTQFEVPADLQPTTRFYWRARARQGTVDGPFSATATFRTRIEGFNRAGELFDPLTNATTVGAAVGNVTLTPGRGVTINTNDSHVRYNLVRTITAGEFSFEADGIQNNSPGDKTKMMAMYDGNGDITTSDWRLTVEKRDGGVIAWRFIAGEPEDEQIDTVGNERVALNFNPGTTYFWRATWGGGFDLNIFEGGMTGNRIYAFGKGLAATYEPNPHVCYLGSPIGRAGANDASVVGATWRLVYIADAGKKRPVSLGTAIIENPADDPRIKNRGVRFVP
jgi:hypothetical protein